MELNPVETVEMHHALITVELLWSYLSCIKPYINKGDTTNYIKSYDQKTQDKQGHTRIKTLGWKGEKYKPVSKNEESLESTWSVLFCCIMVQQSHNYNAAPEMNMHWNIDWSWNYFIMWEQLSFSILSFASASWSTLCLFSENGWLQYIILLITQLTADGKWTLIWAEINLLTCL